jgi:hypothetical protein
MSVCISAIMSHKWPYFSKTIVDEIGEAATLEPAPVYKRIFEPGEHRRKILNDGSELFLLKGEFSVRLGKKIIELGFSQRWGRLLLHKAVRRDFFAALKRVALVAGAQEALVLPESTILADALYDDVNFQAVKQNAMARFGPPDLKDSQFFTKEELSEMSSDRVHYFLLSFWQEPLSPMQ